MKTGLVLEGGSFRGIFTAGVCDSLLDNKIDFDYVVGVSAGSGNAVNFVAGQKERTKKVILHEDADNYYGVGQLRQSGHLLNLDKLVNYEPVPFDLDAYNNSGIPNEVVVANVETGKAEYITGDGSMQSVLDMCKASCSIPIMCAPMVINGKKYLDGSIIDSLPYQRAFDMGCDRVVVVQTRAKEDIPTDYSRMRVLITATYRLTYPKVIDVLMARSGIYAKQLKKMEELRRAGKIMIIRPEAENISHFEKDTAKINEFYNHGYDVMERRMNELHKFMGR